MTIDTAKLDLRLSALLGMAKRKHGYSYEDISQFTDWSASSLNNRKSQKELWRMSIRDVVMLEKLAGEELDRTGLERR